MKAREVIRAIERRGGKLARTKGSHRQYEARDGDVVCRVTVAMHSGDMPKGTLAAIEKSMEPVFGKGWLR